MNIVARSFARESFAQALSAEAFVRAMLDFERALAGAEADAGVIPPGCRRGHRHRVLRICSLSTRDAGPRGQDVRLAGGSAGQGAHRARRARDTRAAAFVHYGSTSQDVLDTALVLCLKPCLADADRVARHRGEPAGRPRATPRAAP